MADELANPAAGAAAATTPATGTTGWDDAMGGW